MIKADIKPMEPEESSEPRELSNAAKKAVTKAINELDSGQCKTFSSIDEFFDDMEND